MSFKQRLKEYLKRQWPYLWVSYAHMRSKKEREIAHLPNLVPLGRRAIDVGAHTGMYTRALARLVPFVDAFEPTMTFNLLSRAVPENVKVHQMAVSDRVGEATLTIPDKADATTLASLEKTFDGKGTKIIVQVTTLDVMFAGEDIGFVKIDVEGHETSVVNGSLGLIRRCHPVFLIECEERHNPGALDQLRKTFHDEKYSCKFLSENGQFNDISSFNHDRDQVEGKTPYINNFIFLPAGHPLA